MDAWNDPKLHRRMRTECDDIMNPCAPHMECNHIAGTYRDGVWMIAVSAQTMDPHQPIDVIVGIPELIDSGQRVRVRFGFKTNRIPHRQSHRITFIYQWRDFHACMVA